MPRLHVWRRLRRLMLSRPDRHAVLFRRSAEAAWRVGSIRGLRCVCLRKDVNGSQRRGASSCLSTCLKKFAHSPEPLLGKLCSMGKGQLQTMPTKAQKWLMHSGECSSCLSSFSGSCGLEEFRKETHSRSLNSRQQPRPRARAVLARSRLNQPRRLAALPDAAQASVAYLDEILASGSNRRCLSTLAIVKKTTL